MATLQSVATKDQYVVFASVAFETEYVASDEFLREIAKSDP